MMRLRIRAASFTCGSRSATTAVLPRAPGLGAPSYPASGNYVHEIHRCAGPVSAAAARSSVRGNPPRLRRRLGAPESDGWALGGVVNDGSDSWPLDCNALETLKSPRRKETSVEGDDSPELPGDADTVRAALE